MGIVTSIYRKNFLIRYDKDEAVPYYRCEDFPGLFLEADSFKNSSGVTIRYYIYHYESYDPRTLILFCPGMGPGHTAYLTEIETLCRAGYRVLTLDYTGCGESGGETMTSVNAPTRDAMELLNLLSPEEEVIPIGHSLGGYTALNIAHLALYVTRAVILSGFVSISDEMMGAVKLRFLADRVKHFEEKLDSRYGSIDNRPYLSATTDHLLWIHSTDDPMVNFKYNAGAVRDLHNPNVRVIAVENKKHNPQYTREALTKMYAWIGEYNRLLREKKLATPEAKKAFFADKSIGQMTEQDPEIWKEILSFIKPEKE
ncbi:MAG: alpha/beta hydrolase [Clostridia bacterium]|nr:alpha/beta hydrolase [Clostridia bacterium]